MKLAHAHGVPLLDEAGWVRVANGAPGVKILTEPPR